MILHLLGLTPADINGRDCKIIWVNSKIAKEFFNTNHISGNTNASVIYGLEYKGDLVLCTSFGKSRFNKHSEWEVIRLATKLNTMVQGGFSKVLTHFKHHHHSSSLMTYVDRRFGEGLGYNQAVLSILEKQTRDILDRWKCSYQ